MKTIQLFSKTLVTFLLILAFQISAQDLPNVVILATGGTIAGSAETKGTFASVSSKTNISAVTVEIVYDTPATKAVIEITLLVAEALTFVLASTNPAKADVYPLTSV